MKSPPVHWLTDKCTGSTNGSWSGFFIFGFWRIFVWLHTLACILWFAIAHFGWMEMHCVSEERDRKVQGIYKVVGGW
jgi:hypothetical protein